MDEQQDSSSGIIIGVAASVVLAVLIFLGGAGALVFLWLAMDREPVAQFEEIGAVVPEVPMAPPASNMEASSL
ncbi:MAG: hypothetical protein NZO58_01590, partial [Gemmataceae bacterium]|nr:hypothetical protein [Gemmataceae bacterium]